MFKAKGGFYMTFTYKTRGTCSSQITFDLNDNIVSNVQFYGGCNGNLKGIASLVEGMTVEEITDRLAGITCGFVHHLASSLNASRENP